MTGRACALLDPAIGRLLGKSLLPQSIALYLPAGRARSARQAGPKITLPFPHLYISCASALITCAIITSRTLLPCDLTSVDFGNLDGCFA